MAEKNERKRKEVTMQESQNKKHLYSLLSVTLGQSFFGGASNRQGFRRFDRDSLRRVIPVQWDTRSRTADIKRSGAMVLLD
jgi:hypothetical protein